MKKFTSAVGMSTRHRLAGGRSLIEILVSLVIGAVILGAILVTVSGTGLSGRRTDAQARLNDEGQIALNVMTSAVRMAGYWTPTSPVGSTDPREPLLRGCEDGFSNPTVGNFEGLNCGGTGQGHSIAVRYDAAQPGAVVRDCLGNAGGALAAAGRVENRYYIATSAATGNPALFCFGNGGGAAPQALVDNVETMEIRYGIAPLGPGELPENFAFFPSAYSGGTTRYLEASDIADCAGGAVVADSWCAVTSVRICVVVRTDDNESDVAGAQYVGCNGQLLAQPDRRIRRALVTTVSLRNRTASALREF